MEFAKITAARIADRVHTLLAQIRAAGSEGNDDEAEGWDDCEVVQPLGLFVLPSISADLEGLFFRDGDESIVVHLLNKGLARLTDMVAGETRLYGAANPAARTRHMPDGETRVESDTGAGKSVVINEGTQGVVRVGDGVARSTAMGAWMAQIETYLNGIAPDTVTPFIGDIGSTSSGSTTVKAG